MNAIQAAAAAAAAAGIGARLGGGGYHRGCDLSASEDQSVATGALDEFRIHCPNCSHQFALSEGLLMEQEEAGSRLMAGGDETASAGADTAHDSVESLALDRDGANHVGSRTVLKVASYGGGGGGGGGSFSRIPVAAASATASRSRGGSAVAADTTDADDDDEDCAMNAAAAAAEPNGDDTKSSQLVSRCYQIINWTVEELEKVICDPKDRRIRKIASISQCDIEVRSELAPTKFGTPKNFCILRASQLVSIDQCRGLLRRQLLWVMRPKAQEAESLPPIPPTPSSPAR